MAIICQQTVTISGSNSTVCGKLIRISNIQDWPNYNRIDIYLIDRELLGIGDYTFTLGNEQIRIQLVSKNASAGTAVITLTISDESNFSSTHRLDFYIKPHSWYSHGGAVDAITAKLGDITGALVNPLSSLTGWEYVSTEIVSDPANNRIIVRINLNDLSAMSTGIRPMAIQFAPIVITPIGIALAIVILYVGHYIGWGVTSVVQYITGETYTGKQVGEHDVEIIERAKQSCAQQFPDDAGGYANCVSANTVAVTGASGDFFDDPTITQAGNDAAARIDSCIAQFNAGQISADQLRTCTNMAANGAKGTITTQTKDLGGLDIGTYLTIAAGLGFTYYVLTRHPEKVKAGYRAAKREYGTAKSAYRTLRS